MRQHSSQLDPARVLLPLGLGTALSLMGDATLYTVLPTHTVEAGITLTGVGILLSVNRAIRLFLNGPAGLAYDRWSHRALFISSLWVGALSTALYALTRGFWPLFAARLLWGLAWSGIQVGGAAMVLDVAGAQRRGRWTGLYQTWFYLGGAVGALGGGLLTDWLGYATTMWVGAALTGIGALAAWLLLPETRQARQRGLAPPPGAPAIETPGLPVRTHGLLWFAASLQGLNRFAVSGVMAATLGLLVQERLFPVQSVLGVAGLTGVLMAARTALSMGAAPAAGILSDRVTSRWPVVALALAAGAVGMATSTSAAPVGLLVGVSIVSLSRGGISSLATSLTGDLATPAQRGRAIGALHTASDLGSAIGPSAAYLMLPVIGLRGVYLACAGLYLIALLWTLRLSGRKT
ncbi:MAG: MFS transporter [Anaerolineae bacterium]|nr:MFS transporter [Anaerolineae bacterium]